MKPAANNNVVCSFGTFTTLLPVSRGF